MITRVALDIETIPLGISLCNSSETADATAEPQPQVLVNGVPIGDEDIKRLSLDATTSQIVCIALAHFDPNSQLREARVFFGEDEGRILTAFWQSLDKFKPTQLVTHNGLNFDLPFIWRRSVIKDVKQTRPFDLARYRTDRVYDTLQVWANWNYRDYVGLNKLAGALGIGTKGGDGSQVHKLWLEGKRLEVARYCLTDVALTYSCFCKMNFLKIPDLIGIEHASSFVDVDTEYRASQELRAATVRR